MGSAPRSIQSLLYTAAPEISDLLGRAAFLERIRGAMLEILPAAAAPHVQIATYENYRLRLHVTQASWGTRLRYMQPAIAQALAQRMRLHIEAVDIRIRPDRHNPAAPPRARALSNQSRDHIRRTADLIEDGPLAESLKRLATAGRTAEE